MVVPNPKKVSPDEKTRPQLGEAVDLLELSPVEIASKPNGV